MDRGPQGSWQSLASPTEGVESFQPTPLPPIPDIVWSADLRAAFDRAHLALGQLDAAATMLPSGTLLRYAFVRKEAVASSMIEGLRSSLTDLLMHEAGYSPDRSADDTVKTSRCATALQKGLDLFNGGLPISVRLIRAVHAELLALAVAVN